MNNMKKLTEYLKECGAVSASKVVGPNGAFVSWKDKDGKTSTIPVGKRSQAGTLHEYNVLIASDTGTPIATVNQYEAVEEINL